MTDARKYESVALILTAMALIGVLELGLLAAFLVGVLTYELIHIVASQIKVRGITHRAGKAVAFGLLTILVLLVLAWGAAWLLAFLTDRSDNIVVLLQKMADVVETARIHFPLWAQGYLPANAEEWEAIASGWLRDHVGELQRVGENFGRVLANMLIGAIIGGLAALGERRPHPLPPLTRALTERAIILGTAFRHIVFAQIRISTLNTLLTSLYLLILLPLMGVDLPLLKTMIAVTFFAGLLPVIGNLISNTVIVIVSLSVSHYAAMGSLIFLALMHKLEYFVNARIIGMQISARAWEMLLAMLVMEAAFGVQGIIAAPIYYAYIKDELHARCII